MVVESLQVGFSLLGILRSSLRVLAQEPTLAPTLPEPVRQIAYMALLGIALVGMLLIVATLLGGHWVRRWGDRLRRPAVPPDVIAAKQPQIDRSGGHGEAGSEGHSVGHSDNHSEDRSPGHDGGGQRSPEDEK